jgi:hypothetical protein
MGGVTVLFAATPAPQALAADGDDVAALNTLLATEHAVIFDLATAGATLPAAARATVLQHYDEHRARRDELTRHIRRLGGAPVAALAAYADPAGAARGPAAVIAVEAAAVRAYHASIATVGDTDARVLCAQAFVTEARHLALARSAAGLAGAPAAFVTGADS